MEKTHKKNIAFLKFYYLINATYKCERTTKKKTKKKKKKVMPVVND